MNMRKKDTAISPVIATIILVAVTLVISVAVGSYVFGLFGASTATPQISVVNSQLSAATDTLTVTMLNKGSSAVAVQSATVSILNVTSTSTLGTPVAILPAGTNTATFGTWTPGIPVTHFVAGQSYTFRLAFSDGSTQVVVVIAQ